MPVDVRERAETIPFHFVHPIGMIEGLAGDGERHGCEFGKHKWTAYFLLIRYASSAVDARRDALRRRRNIQCGHAIPVVAFRPND